MAPNEPLLWQRALLTQEVRGRPRGQMRCTPKPLPRCALSTRRSKLQPGHAAPKQSLPAHPSPSPSLSLDLALPDQVEDILAGQHSSGSDASDVIASASIRTNYARLTGWTIAGGAAGGSGSGTGGGGGGGGSSSAAGRRAVEGDCPSERRVSVGPAEGVVTSKPAAHQ
jgi:hypothetical protein